MKRRKTLLSVLLSVSLILTFAGCSKTDQTIDNSSQNTQTQNTQSSSGTENTQSTDTSISVSDYFTDRDLAQEADLSEAVYITVNDSDILTLSKAGVYVLSGKAAEAQIIVDAGDDDKVQLVLDSLEITNSSLAAIYVKNADKVFVTTSSASSLIVTGTFTADGSDEIDAVIYSKEDLVLNGTSTLTIRSSDNAVSGKDDLKVTGGTYIINASGHGLEGKDSVLIYDGTFTITAGKDGIQSVNSDDNTLGYVYIFGGTMKISAKSDGIKAQTVLMINDGTITVSASEGLEATHVIINGGTLNISATDDGINAAKESTALSVALEINGGNITIKMSSGDTDAIDTNGSLAITGGYIDITGQFAFDFDYGATFTGGTVYVNGTQVTSLNNSMNGGMQGERSGFGPRR